MKLVDEYAKPDVLPRASLRALLDTAEIAKAATKATPETCQNLRQALLDVAQRIETIVRNAI